MILQGHGVLQTYLFSILPVGGGSLPVQCNPTSSAKQKQPKPQPKPPKVLNPRLVFLSQIVKGKKETLKNGWFVVTQPTLKNSLTQFFWP